MSDTSPEITRFDSQDVEKNKVLAIVGYIFPILFFIPLITDAKNSTYAKFHANQHLILLILAFAFTAARIFIAIAMPHMIGKFISPALSLVHLALLVIGIMNATSGEPKKLPVVGDLATLIK